MTTTAADTETYTATFRREREAHDRQMREVGASISGAMTARMTEGSAWSFSIIDYGDVEIVSAAEPDVRLRVYTVYNKPGRLGIRGVFPPMPAGISVYGADSSVITVAADRDPQDIAKEVERRLLPRYRLALAAWRSRAEQQRDAERATQRAAEQIRAAGPQFSVQVSERKPVEATIYADLGEGRGWVRGRLASGSVTLELRSLSAEEAVRVVRALCGTDQPTLQESYRAFFPDA